MLWTNHVLVVTTNYLSRRNYLQPTQHPRYLLPDHLSNERLFISLQAISHAGAQKRRWKKTALHLNSQRRHRLIKKSKNRMTRSRAHATLTFHDKQNITGRLQTKTRTSGEYSNPKWARRRTTPSSLCLWICEANSWSPKAGNRLSTDRLKILKRILINDCGSSPKWLIWTVRRTSQRS